MKNTDLRIEFSKETKTRFNVEWVVYNDYVYWLEQKLVKLLTIPPVMPSLFAVSTEEGINELFWSKKKAEEKFAIYVKEFPSTLFWVEEVFPS